MSSNAAQQSQRSIFAVRLAAAAVQAAALNWLVSAGMATPPMWPVTQRWLLEPLALVILFAPLLVMLGIGHIRAWQLALWTIVASGMLVGLGCHAATREAAGGSLWSFDELAVFRLFLLLAGLLFVANVLVVDGVAERRWLSPYSRHFDTALKQGLQLALALGFIGVFWAVLFLGGGLFKLVDIGFVLHLLARPWFAIAATTLAGAVAIHIADVQPGLIRGARAILLTLLSWLQPLLAVILAGFIAVLPFVSLATLWNTHFAASLLLWAAGTMIVLINCAYQDGTTEQAASRMRRIFGSVGAVELVPLLALAIWAVALRVAQHGWTVRRIEAAAVIGVLLPLAIGYATAIVRSRTWLKRLEVSNRVAAYGFLAVALGLSTPVADPSRLMVADQMARLASGAVQPGEFDFAALKFDGARWGADALAGLAARQQGQGGETIVRLAKQAQAMTYRPADPRSGHRPGAEAVAGRFVVYPEGRTLPAGFYEAVALGQSWTPPCFQQGAEKCVARIVTLPSGGELVLMAGMNTVFAPNATGLWEHVGDIAGNLYCPSVQQGFPSGDIATVPHPWPDVIIGKETLAIQPVPRACNPAR